MFNKPGSPIFTVFTLNRPKLHDILREEMKKYGLYPGHKSERPFHSISLPTVSFSISSHAGVLKTNYFIFVVVRDIFTLFSFLKDIFAY